MPEYNSKETVREKLLKSLKESGSGFDLSWKWYNNKYKHFINWLQPALIFPLVNILYFFYKKKNKILCLEVNLILLA